MNTVCHAWMTEDLDQDKAVGAEVIERVDRLRKLKGWTKAQLAREVGTTRQIVHNWYAGRTSPGPALILALARALDTSASFLLGEIQEHRRPAEWFSGPGESETVEQAIRLMEQATNLLKFRQL